MSDIHPFCGLRYNQTLIRDLARVACPPYDIIPPHVQSALCERSEHNFIRLEHARSLPQDTASENKYTRSASTLAHWLAQVMKPRPFTSMTTIFRIRARNTEGEALSRWSGWKSGTGG